MTYYISGQIAGAPDGNQGLFRATQRALQTMLPDATVINPHDHGLPFGFSRDAVMDASLKSLRQADAIVLLPGYQASRGAALELSLAVHERKRIYFWDGSQLVNPKPPETTGWPIGWEACVGS